MSCSQNEMKKAVECGYWHLYRYDPRRIAEGKNPFQLDSPEPDTSKLMDYLMGENRFASLKNNFPEKADALYQPRPLPTSRRVTRSTARWRRTTEPSITACVYDASPFIKKQGREFPAPVFLHDRRWNLWKSPAAAARLAGCSR